MPPAGPDATVSRAGLTALAVVPARLASERFPGKVLADRTGRPMVQHVVDRLSGCRSIAGVVVATDAPEVVGRLEAYGTRCVLTSAAHSSGTDRIAEAADRLDVPDDAVVVNVQADEPEIDPDAVDRLVARMASPDAPEMATLACPLAADADPADPNLVKVVCDAAGRALYFSRSPIPYDRGGGGRPLLHVGVYAYRRRFLRQVTRWPPGRLEAVEKLEQLRVLENGVAIHVQTVGHAASGIDTLRQYEAFVRRWQARRSSP